FLPLPGCAIYCTTKFAVRGFTESVRAEMLGAGHPVQVSVVHPGGIKTNIATAALETAKGLGLPITEAEERRSKTYNEKLLKMPPEQAAKIVVDGVESGKSRILVGNDAKFVDALVRLLPSRYPKVAVTFEKRLHSTS
ncbi:MAG: SDR family NAD(P)-dependent oxidoreductase, partial [Thermoleophilaceae bacterium]